jgi:DNA-binding transcriptional regulator/RsmH inhibitor MraZ
MRELPRGMYSGRLDDKGRLKLPVDFHNHFRALQEQKLYVTSLDRKTAAVYPLYKWREVEAFLDNYHDDPAAAMNVAFVAAELGSEAEPDAQGRILFSQELRKQLNLEDQPLKLWARNGHVEVLSEDSFRQKQEQSKQTPEQDLAKLRAAGMKC